MIVEDKSIDYMGVLHITILCDISFGELLVDSLQRVDLRDVFIPYRFYSS